MSGICGILRLDGAPPAGIEAMCDRLRRRGPEGTRVFRDGPCALGHTLLGTTPEALVEQLPLTHPETGCTITADCRIDNRAELLTAFGLTQVGRVVGDGELILRAWLRWGEDCPNHLLGDFAFAIWDPRSRRLFCARDQMGMKQLIWSHVEGRVFAFASEPGAVVLADGVPRVLNEGRIADALESYLELIDRTSTFFAGVQRLEPAHCLTVRTQGASKRRYWQLQPEPELTLPSDAAYVEAFRDVFRTAVSDRLRGPPQIIGSMLSGGMDSGAISAVASRLMQERGEGPFATYSVVTPDPACIESQRVRASLTMPNLRPTVIDTGDLGDWITAMVEQSAASEEPFEAGFGVVRSAYIAAARQGVKVVMSGIGGDTVFAAGTWIARLMAQGRWRAAWTECRGEADYWQHGWRARDSAWLALRQWGMPTPVRRLRESWRSTAVPKGSLLHPDFARRVDVPGRIRRYNRQDPWFWGPWGLERVRAITSNTMTTGLENYDRAAGVAGVEPRDPFFDLRVVRFCLSLPGRQLLRDGWPKYLLRQAMQGYLPDAVCWGQGKHHVGPAITRAGLSGAGIDQTRLQDFRPELAGFVSPDIWPAAGQGPARMLTNDELASLWGLAVWLRRNSPSP